jgi:hypothetical protein
MSKNISVRQPEALYGERTLAIIKMDFWIGRHRWK